MKNHLLTRAFALSMIFSAASIVPALACEAHNQSHAPKQSYAPKDGQQQQSHGHQPSQDVQQQGAHKSFQLPQQDSREQLTHEHKLPHLRNAPQL